MSLRESRATAVAFVTLAALTDLIAYSIAVPVLPDLGRRLGASPTTIGVLFASFGLTVLAVSVPMGAASDRGGRKTPLVAGAIVLVGSTLLFAYADSLGWLFASRLLQGAADAVTWVVGFALIADLYGPAERGRVMGLVLGGSNFGLMIGPSLGGWLYEAGGIRLPFLVVAALGAVAAAGLAWLRVPVAPGSEDPVPDRPQPAASSSPGLQILAAWRVPEVRSCAAAVVVAGGTIGMLEPVLSLFLSYEMGLAPSRIGVVFGVAAAAATLLHPLVVRLADRAGGRRLTIAGLIAMALALPLVSLIGSFETAIGVYVLQAVAIAIVATPSLAYMADAISSGGIRSFGVAYGVYNFAWALGLLVGPGIGGFLYEQLGLRVLSIAWAPFALAAALIVARTRNVTTDARGR